MPRQRQQNLKDKNLPNMNIKELVLTPAEAFDEASFLPVLYKKLAIPRDGSVAVVPLKRSVDARGRHIVVRVQYDIVERTTLL